MAAVSHEKPKRVAIIGGGLVSEACIKVLIAPHTCMMVYASLILDTCSLKSSI